MNFLGQLEDLETVERQIKYCNLVVINKVDLVDKNFIGKIKEKILEINTNVEIQETSFGKLNYDFLKEDLMSNEWVIHCFRWGRLPIFGFDVQL